MMDLSRRRADVNDKTQQIHTLSKLHVVSRNTLSVSLLSLNCLCVDSEPETARAGLESSSQHPLEAPDKAF